jgi:hypothetical protein
MDADGEHQRYASEVTRCRLFVGTPRCYGLLSSAYSSVPFLILTFQQH